jgi:hypothetical protein
MTNSEIAECIEDARIVRETARANARQVLEDIFSAKYKAEFKDEYYSKVTIKGQPKNLFVHILED